MVWEQAINNVVGGLVTIKVMEAGSKMIDKASKTRYTKTKKRTRRSRSSGFGGNIPI